MPDHDYEYAPDDMPLPGICSVGHKVWTCEVSVSSHGWLVSPTRGLLCVGNWALNPYHYQGIRGAWATFWRTITGAYFRREYPKSERMLRRAIAECEVFCVREEAEEAHLSAVRNRVLSGRNTPVVEDANNA